MLGGLIPAFAGSTAWRSAALQAAGAHPRVRGEHPAGICPSLRDEGSSPRSRGALRLPDVVEHRGGLIPAFAGSTRHPMWCPRGGWAHPRVRGEHRSGKSGASPPRAHPRVRGEHTISESGVDVELGSSPRSRGALAVVRQTHGVDGLIPAFAGSTISVRRFFANGQWLIPAFAGSTAARAPTFRDVWAHPRVRGEHAARSGCERHRVGSSPRSRGARLSHGSVSCRVGLIPAFAGSTYRATYIDASRLGSSPRSRGAH